MRVILASSSPRRRELLTRLGLPFTVMRPDIDESVQPGEAADRYVARLSREKAQAIRVALSPDQVADTVIIAADTTVALGEAILGKPTSPDEATAMLRDLRGRTHVVYTGVTVQHAESGRTLTEVDESGVLMRAYTDQEIAAYVASGEPFDKAGGYAIQSPDLHPVQRIVGCYANVMGLPLTRLCRMLVQSGVSVPDPTPCALGTDPPNDPSTVCRMRF